MKETVDYKGKEYTIKYRHERILDDCGNPLNRGGKTFAYIVLKYDSNGKPSSVVEAEAQCHKIDAFDKAMGRTIAKGRLLKKLETYDDVCFM